MGISAGNRHKRRRAASKKNRKASAAGRSAHTVSAGGAKSAESHPRKKPTRIMAIAAASGALLQAAIKMLMPSRDR